MIEFSQVQLSDNKGFKEIWRKDSQLKNLSCRRQATYTESSTIDLLRHSSFGLPVPRHGGSTVARFLTYKENCKIEFSESEVRITT
jgi:hypothetical protein